MSDTFRCPSCLFEMSAPESPDPEAAYACLGCHQNFLLKDALPGATDDTANQPELPGGKKFIFQQPEEQDESKSANQAVVAEIPASMRPLWLITAALAAAGCVTVLVMGKSLRGPEFLKIFIGLGLVLAISQAIIRTKLLDRISISVMAFVIFGSIGLTRLIAGYYLWEMRNFTYLLGIMTFGGFFIFFRNDGSGSNHHHDDSGCGSSSCGSSCGGGGCGGGGCGGCGD